MKKESTVMYCLRLTLTLLVITAVVAGALAGVNAVTKDRIAASQAEKTRVAIGTVLPGAQNPQPVTLPMDTAAQIAAVYTDTVDGQPAYAVEVHPAGFGDVIVMVVGVAKDGKILGISIIKHGETPGLGAVAASTGAAGVAFRNQFVGQSGTLAVKKDGGSVDAISGATITSRAVTEGVNLATSWVAANG